MIAVTKRPLVIVAIVDVAVRPLVLVQPPAPSSYKTRLAVPGGVQPEPPPPVIVTVEPLIEPFGTITFLAGVVRTVPSAVIQSVDGTDCADAHMAALATRRIARSVFFIVL